MSFLLCHECYCWVEPVEGRCPDCTCLIEETTPDPPPEQLGAILGEVITRLGEVRVGRALLPDRGTLYATSNGFLFLPHTIERVREVHPEGTRPAGDVTPLLWLAAALIWSPLQYLLPFIKPNRPKSRHVHIYRPQFLARGESRRLAELLMQNPGVFFVPKKSIRIVERRRKHWALERFGNSPVKLTPGAGSRHFHKRMTELADSAAWQDVMFGI